MSVLVFSQPVEKIKFKKDPSLIYFFQKGLRSDTLHAKNENLFYLVVPDSLKKNLSIAVENAQLMATSNDSIVKLNYLPGFKYESLYLVEEKAIGKTSIQKKYTYKTLVDGISVFPHQQIIISLINKATGGLILENTFVYWK